MSPYVIGIILFLVIDANSKIFFMKGLLPKISEKGGTLYGFIFNFNIDLTNLWFNEIIDS